MPLPLSSLLTSSLPWIKPARRVFPAVAAAFAIAAFCFAPLPAAAQDKEACDQFNWPVKRELALFKNPNLEMVFSGAAIPAIPAKGVALELQPYFTVDYVLAPAKQPKPEDSWGGVLVIQNIPKAGSYQVTASEHAWIDLIQNGKELASTAHTGNPDCAGVRKSVRFDLEPGPLTVQVSGAEAKQIKLAIFPAE